jgi:hypothetical protein
MRSVFINIKQFSLSRCMLRLVWSSIAFLTYSQLFSQNMEVHDVNRYGLKDMFPSIIIEEGARGAEYNVYTVNEYGLKHIHPDEIIENDNFTGTWKVYRVSDFGLKDLFPKSVTETDTYDDALKVYDVGDFGLKEVFPSTIIEKDPSTGRIELFDVSQYGLKELFPFEVIKKEGEDYNVYGVNRYGIPEIIPKRVIEVKENPEVFGILLLPSIKQIKFEPDHEKLQLLREIKKLPVEEASKKGWLKSNPNP